MSIYYDPAQRAYVDSETGTLIPVDENDEVHTLHHQKSSPSPPPRRPSKAVKDQLERDHQLALRLSQIPDIEQRVPLDRIEVRQTNPTNASPPTFLHTVMSTLTSLFTTNEYDRLRRTINRDSNPNELGGSESTSSRSGAPANGDDWSLARALQAMEFEMEDDLIRMQEQRDGDFTTKEYRASSCLSQMLTMSTLIVLVQIGILVAMIQVGGTVPRSQNAMIGPSAQVLVNFGAKEAGLVVKRHQWWRLITPIFLHAGILHLLSNGAIQLRVGGYLNQVFGTAKWMWIYFVSGIFGNMMSCIFLPNSISVGSSGAVLGMLTSWIVWIIYRWKKIPDRAKANRNCQLIVVFACVAITLGTSFAKYVDWSAHFGGVIQGFLWAMVLLSSELENPMTRMFVVIVGISASAILFACAIYYMIVVLDPPIVLSPN